jgi:hypothetical protein
MILAFEKKMNVNIQNENDVDEIFIAAFNSRINAEGFLAEHIPGINIDNVVFKECIILR